MRADWSLWLYVSNREVVQILTRIDFPTIPALLDAGLAHVEHA